MITVNIRQAKTNLSKLIEAAMHGDEVIITKVGKPAVKLIPITPVKHVRKPGALKGKIMIKDSFDAQLPSEILEHFYK